MGDIVGGEQRDLINQIEVNNIETRENVVGANE
jgi:hypothetical protein